MFDPNRVQILKDSQRLHISIIFQRGVSKNLGDYCYPLMQQSTTEAYGVLTPTLRNVE